MVEGNQLKGSTIQNGNSISGLLMDSLGSGSHTKKISGKFN